MGHSRMTERTFKTGVFGDAKGRPFPSQSILGTTSPRSLHLAEGRHAVFNFELGDMVANDMDNAGNLITLVKTR